MRAKKVEPADRAVIDVSREKHYSFNPSGMYGAGFLNGNDEGKKVISDIIDQGGDIDSAKTFSP